jgi:hypothetical protein
MNNLISTLEVIFCAFCGKTFTPPRHKDPKMNINQKVTPFALCLGAFVAICSGLSGLGITYILGGRENHVYHLR